MSFVFCTQRSVLQATFCNLGVVIGKAVIQGTEYTVLANTDQCVVVASDNLTVVVTNNTVFVGDRNTDMKALVEEVAQQAPDIV